MKSIKQALLGLALVTCATVNAYAVPTYEGASFVPADFSNPGTLVTWMFGLGDATVKSGETFAWEFLFNMPPSDPTTSFAFLTTPDHAGDVSFSSVDFYGYGFSYTVVPGFSLINAGNAVAGYGWLDSGVYDLYVTGTFLADGAGFTGMALDDITDVSAAVPEPMSMALFGLGLAGLAGARRRRAA